MVTSRLYRVERLWRHSNARRGVWKSCHVVTSVPESAGKNALPSNVQELSRGNLTVVIKLLSLAGNCPEGIAVKSPVVRFWNVNISALETAVNVGREECTSLARPTVKEYEFACTFVKSLARKTVHLVLRNVRTDALTADVLNSVWNLARLAGRDVPGFALTSSARSFAARNATVLDVTNRARRDCLEALASVISTTHVSVFVGNHAPGCAEFATKTRLPRCSLERKRTKTRGSLSCWTVDMCLRLQRWITGWTKTVKLTISS